MNKSWTKYGGARMGNEAIYVSTEWYCQSCQKYCEKDEIPFSYRFNGDDIRICSQCADNNCAALQRRL